MFKVLILPWRNHLTGLDFVALTMCDGLAKTHGSHILCASNTPDQGWSNFHQRIRCLGEVGKISFSPYLLLISSGRISLDLKKKTNTFIMKQRLKITKKNHSIETPSSQLAEAAL